MIQRGFIMKSTKKGLVLIPKSRFPKPSPEALVINGQTQWGTFDTALSKINLLDSENPLGTKFPKFLKPFRLKEWEAFQIDSEDYFVLGAIYQTNVASLNILSLWDKKKNTLQTWQSYARPSQLVMADNLIESVNHLSTSNSSLWFHNQLDKGLCRIEGRFKGKNKDKPNFSLNCLLTSCSKPSVVSMPLGKNRGLYTHKEVFNVSGSMQIGAEKINFTDSNLAIIDDHKGFYPYKLHYDWITGMETHENGDVLAFNLTKNQVIKPVEYNENLLWLNGERHPLPPVHFEHQKDGTWHIRDDIGYVDLVMKPEQHLIIKNDFIVSKIDYHAPFGTFSGTLKDQMGKPHQVKCAYGMGENKTYRL